MVPVIKKRKSGFYSTVAAIAATGILILFNEGCSTQKNKFINRSYHNTTARFNGYFNAKETIKESLIDFHVKYKDDYTKILPVFIIPDENSSKSMYEPMNRAIEKTSNVIKRHSMPNPEKTRDKKQEWCKWIDDNWLVMGQAYYYKRELTDAKVRFDYVMKQYGKLPIKYEGTLWLARTHMEENDMVNAQRYLDRLQDKLDEANDPEKKSKKVKKRSTNSRNSDAEEPAFPMYIADELEKAWSDFYIRKKEYTKAIEHLKKAIDLTRGKKDRARLCFILAQLYQQKGDRASAVFYYTKVDKLNPEYEMEFYSRIFRALISDGDNVSALKRQLLKMARDEKNKDYLDQIYYALADIELKAQNRTGGINYLNLSVQASTTNGRQKGLSYMRLGDLFYSEKNFIKSKMYYDSTILNLPKEYENYDQVRTRSEGLKDLVTNLLIIQHEDSVQRIARMPKKEMEKYLDDVIRKRKEEEERLKQIELNKENKTTNTANTTNTGNSNWYWWNPTAIQKGYTDFKKVWGTRKPEDNWRRTDKSASADFTDPNVVDSLNTNNKNDDPLAEREKLLKKLPLTDSLMKISHGKLSTALFNAGGIYKDRLNETGLAAQTLKRFIKDYPDHDQALPALYILYRIYSEKDPTQAEEYKNMILTKYPDSDYAKIIRNPNYLAEEAEKLKIYERKYEEAFGYYKKKDLSATITLCDEVIATGDKSPVIPRFYYLKSIALGNQARYEEMEATLVTLVDTYPKDEMGKTGAELLEIVRSRNSMNDARSGKTVYVFEPNEEHFFVLVFPNTMGAVNDAKNKVSNFDQQSFSDQTLKITNNFIDLDNQLILVKAFANKEKAMNYYIAFENEPELLRGLNDIATFFVITNRNYASFYLDKKIEHYITFFEENYK
ncbi:MAG: tetratricopeptide repeat protein [Flavobacteriales bacterium]